MKESITYQLALDLTGSETTPDKSSDKEETQE